MCAFPWRRSSCLSGDRLQFITTCKSYARAQILTATKEKSEKIYLELFVAFTSARAVPRVTRHEVALPPAFSEPLRRYVMVCRTMAKCNCQTSFIERLYRPRAASSVPDGISVSELSIPSHMDGNPPQSLRARLESLIAFTGAFYSERSGFDRAFRDRAFY